jgi:hypothetical protein
MKYAADKNDSSYYFRLDSIMNFNWHKVIFIGPYFSSMENINGCNMDFSFLENTAINVDDRFSGLLFLNEKNKSVKFLQFEGNFPQGFETLNTRTCGTLAEQAIFRVTNGANGVQTIQIK